MSSYTPGTDLWLERSRLNGMTLSAVTYGMLFILTIQATVALAQRPRFGGQIARNRWAFISYIWITFVLATVGFAGNARYTEMIWIDLRNVSGGPTALILDEMNYWVNMVALTCYFVMEWFMQALLLHRCFVIWNWKKHIVVPMSTIFAAMVAMSILVLAEASGAVFYNINTELAYLCLEVGLTIIYTILVAGRLFSYRRKTRDILGREHVRPYETVAMMVIESASLYSVFGIIYIFSFAFHSNVSNLVLFSVSHIQGIAQLLIIIRVANGLGFEQTSQSQRNKTSVMFSGPLSQRSAPVVSFPDTDRGIQSLNSWTGEKPLIHSHGDHALGH